jgi:hypothetical protein
MKPFDAPEIVIAFLLAAGAAWAIYNWTHPSAHSSK